MRCLRSKEKNVKPIFPAHRAFQFPLQHRPPACGPTLPLAYAGGFPLRASRATSPSECDRDSANVPFPCHVDSDGCDLLSNHQVLGNSVEVGWSFIAVGQFGPSGDDYSREGDIGHGAACYPRGMGGSPRGKDKPRPSYEDGKLRDPSILERAEPVSPESLRRLVRRAVETRTHSARVPHPE